MTGPKLAIPAGKRSSPAAYLEQWGPRLFPPYFEAVLHPFFTALLPMDADERVAAMLSSFPQFALFMQPPHGRTSPERAEATASPGMAEAHMSQSSKGASEGPGSLDRSVVDPGGIAGGLGTQLSSVAGPAMQVSTSFAPAAVISHNSCTIEHNLLWACGQLFCESLQIDSTYQECMAAWSLLSAGCKRCSSKQVVTLCIEVVGVNLSTTIRLLHAEKMLHQLNIHMDGQLLDFAV